jgi:hypothetical protein
VLPELDHHLVRVHPRHRLEIVRRALREEVLHRRLVLGLDVDVERQAIFDRAQHVLLPLIATGQIEQPLIEARRAGRMQQRLGAGRGGRPEGSEEDGGAEGEGAKGCHVPRIPRPGR